MIRAVPFREYGSGDPELTTRHLAVEVRETARNVFVEYLVREWGSCLIVGIFTVKLGVNDEHVNGFTRRCSHDRLCRRPFWKARRQVSGTFELLRNRWCGHPQPEEEEEHSSGHGYKMYQAEGKSNLFSRG